MADDLIARVSTTVNAPVRRVWSALTDPSLIKEYMFGAKVTTDWRQGSPITWSGEWQGQPYEDKGVVLKFEPQHLIQYSHYSPLSGMPDVPENYHTVTIELAGNARGTLLTLSQDHNATEEERDHSEKNWSMMLDSLKSAVEG